MRTLLRCALLSVSLGSLPLFARTVPTDDAPGRVEVLCSRASGFIRVNIHNDRPIGKVVIEVVDADGRTWYKEEGRALDSELVRRLDKGAFPKREFTLKVTAKDFSVARPFVVD